MIEQLDRSSESILGFKLSGKLHDEDYKHFVPKVEAAIAEHGNVSLLVWLDDFHGWDMKAMWDDFKFGVSNYSNFNRIALVGEAKWQEWMAMFCRPFTKAQVKYFDAVELESAWEWVESESIVAGAG